jgi:hypothetical protein
MTGATGGSTSSQDHAIEAGQRSGRAVPAPLARMATEGDQINLRKCVEAYRALRYLAFRPGRT